MVTPMVEEVPVEIVLVAGCGIASLNDSTQKTLKDLLPAFGRKAVEKEDKRTYLLISRRSILESAFRGMKRSTFDLKGNMYVKFSGEEGLDHGGPRREFFRLALDELHRSSMFTGPEGNKLFAHNIDLLEQGNYRLAGRLIGLSLAQDGPGPHFLNETLYDLMVGTDIDISTFDTNILPVDSRDVLQELQKTETAEQMDAYLVKWGDWLIDAGIPNVWRLKVGEKNDMGKKVTKQLIYYRIQSEISEFVMGLNDVSGLWDLVKENHRAFKTIFCYRPDSLTKEVFDTLFKPDLSELGSNRRAGEDETLYSWELFLQDIAEVAIDVSFEELLSFVTGADHIPPTGFKEDLSIQFYTQENTITRFPFASTCAMELHLPRGCSEPENFRKMMVRAIKESSGFQKL